MTSNVQQWNPGGSTVPRPTILLADENPVRREWVRVALTNLGQLRVFDDGHALLEHLLGPSQPAHHESGPSLVIASALLRGPNGRQLLVAARASGLLVPFIVLLDFCGSEAQVLVSSRYGTRLESRVFGPARLRAAAEELLSDESARWKSRADSDDPTAPTARSRGDDREAEVKK